VLDASAVLAFLQGKSGAEAVERRLSGAGICAVNLSEVAGKLSDAGMPEAEAHAAVDALGLSVIPFDEGLAWRSAALRPAARRLGLSLGDRACLATALALGLPVVGGDRVWSSLELPIPVERIR
jgi:PIN domain nuclease of toxin-antitoxin system